MRVGKQLGRSRSTSSVLRWKSLQHLFDVWAKGGSTRPHSHFWGAEQEKERWRHLLRNRLKHSRHAVCAAQTSDRLNQGSVVQTRNFAQVGHFLLQSRQGGRSLSYFCSRIARGDSGESGRRTDLSSSLNQRKWIASKTQMLIKSQHIRARENSLV